MTISTPAIPYGLARSWLLAPAVDDERLRAAHNSDADVVIIDIEDGVPERNKEQARLMTRRWLEDDNGWVRINDATTTHWNEDVSALQPVHRRGAVSRPARLRDR
ncbi:putative citrate lyase beta chain [Rhodococcus wratislaviensis NBRC 100605]|uniref:Putative citrate lyase beta chain n=1 Tax=Rhodococcus wratislaviensis NBRC 100605 TaxID=1219028 RepID=X0RGB2_RHOWR|nr:putative citrate lyase beta chain [Rhodococcus wratislaviensis NBRC 100605]